MLTEQNAASRSEDQFEGTAGRDKTHLQTQVRDAQGTCKTYLKQRAQRALPATASRATMWLLKPPMVSVCRAAS